MPSLLCILWQSDWKAIEEEGLHITFVNVRDVPPTVLPHLDDMVGVHSPGATMHFNDLLADPEVDMHDVEKLSADFQAFVDLVLAAAAPGNPKTIPNNASCARIIRLQMHLDGSDSAPGGDDSCLLHLRMTKKLLAKNKKNKRARK